METYKLETKITKDAKIECKLPTYISHLRSKEVEIIIIPKGTPEAILQNAKTLAKEKVKKGWTKEDAVAALLEMKKNIKLPKIEE